MQEQPDCGIDVYADLIPMMKLLIIRSMYSVRKSIDPHRRKHSFEVFGYDFILDEDFNCWLIEVNTNPCLEESSKLLKMLLPRMVEDMLRITVDNIFPRTFRKKRSSMKSPNKGINRKLSGMTTSVIAGSTTGNTLDCIQEEEKIEHDDDLHNEYEDKNPDMDENDENEKSEVRRKAAKRIHTVTGYPDA